MVVVVVFGCRRLSTIAKCLRPAAEVRCRHRQVFAMAVVVVVAAVATEAAAVSEGECRSAEPNIAAADDGRTAESIASRTLRPTLCRPTLHHHSLQERKRAGANERGLDGAVLICSCAGAVSTNHA